MADTKINWTDSVWNPVTGCTKTSSGCANCYAEKMANRLQRMGQAKYRDGFAVRCHPGELEKPLRWRKPRRVFVNSMSDLFHEEVPFDFFDAVFGVMAATPHITYQVLTKRAGRMCRFFHGLGRQGNVVARVAMEGHGIRPDCFPEDWPLPNVWLGVTVEHPDYLDRLDLLRATPAAVRFVSAEPLLADLGEIDLTGIDQVIVGAESGPKRRPMNLDWVRSIRDQCAQAGVPFFFKQAEVDGKVVSMPTLDGREHNQFPEVRRG